MQDGIGGAVDLSHSPGADLLRDPVVRERFANHAARILADRTSWVFGREQTCEEGGRMSRGVSGSGSFGHLLRFVTCKPRGVDRHNAVVAEDQNDVARAA